MLSILDILTAAQGQFDGDVKTLIEIHGKMSAIRSKYQEYKDLETQARQLDERIRAQIGAFGALLQDKAIEELSFNVGITTTSIEQAKNTPLWKIVREIARQVTEIRIIELEQLITNLGHEVSRQAIESAIKTHSSIFRVVRRGREAFVSLK